MFVYYFVDPDLRVEIIFRKERMAERGGIDFEIVDIDTSAPLVLVHKMIPFFGSPWGTKHNMNFSNLRLSTF